MTEGTTAAHDHHHPGQQQHSNPQNWPEAQGVVVSQRLGPINYSGPPNPFSQSPAVGPAAPPAAYSTIIHILIVDVGMVSTFSDFQQQQQLQPTDRVFQVSIAFIYDSARFGGYQPNPT